MKWLGCFNRRHSFSYISIYKYNKGLPGWYKITVTVKCSSSSTSAVCFLNQSLNFRFTVPALLNGPLWLCKAVYIMNKVYADMPFNHLAIYSVNINIYNFSYCTAKRIMSQKKKKSLSWRIINYTALLQNTNIYTVYTDSRVAGAQSIQLQNSNSEGPKTCNQSACPSNVRLRWPSAAVSAL